MTKGKQKTERPSVPDGMTEYVNERLNVRFTVPERVTVMDQLEYKGRIAGTQQATIFLRHWQGAVPLIRDWTSNEWDESGFKPCKSLPEPGAVDLAEETAVVVTDIVFWASNAVAGHMQQLGQVPKNG